MLQALKDRLSQVRARQAQQEESEGRRLALTQELAQRVRLFNELKADGRYAAYFQLLTEAKEEFENVRHELLVADDSPNDRNEQVLVLSGKIQIIKDILSMPENFSALLEKSRMRQENGRHHSQSTEAAP